MTIKRMFMFLCLIQVMVSTANAQNYFIPSASPEEDIRTAFERASENDRILIIFGADWCPDCRALQSSLNTTQLSQLIRDNYEIVKIDVGRFNKNIHLALEYGIDIRKGIPAAVILNKQEQVLYGTYNGEWRNARDMSPQAFLLELTNHTPEDEVNVR